MSIRSDIRVDTLYANKSTIVFIFCYISNYVAKHNNIVYIKYIIVLIIIKENAHHSLNH